MTTQGNHNGAVLTAHEATIQTATIAIQVLRVGKKQVTMGMFRQLPYEQILDCATFLDSLRAGFPPCPFPNGSLWGHVNYWWTGDFHGDETYTNEWGQWRGHGDKRHVVWERDGVLKRAILCERIPKWVFETWPDAGLLQVPWLGIWNHEILTLPQLFIAV